MGNEVREIDTQWIPLNYPERSSFNDTYGFAGSQGRVHVEAIVMPPRERPSNTLFHYAGQPD